MTLSRTGLLDHSNTALYVWVRFLGTIELKLFSLTVTKYFEFEIMVHSTAMQYLAFDDPCEFALLAILIY